MNLTRRVLIGAAAAAFAAGAFGAAVGAADKKVAIVLPGSITDQAFNQVLYEGIVLVGKELSVETAYSEKVKQADQSEHLEDYARRGYGLVFGAGGEFVESTKRAARRYKDTQFVCLNCAVVEGVATVGYNNHAIGYILGYVGGKMSKTGKLGIVSGQKIKPILDIAEGMRKGMKDATGGGEVLITYTNDWDDVAKAKEATFGQVSQGADAVLPYLDNGIVGVMQGLEEKGKFGLGAITDLNTNWPKTNLISVSQDWRQAILHYAALYMDGKNESKNYVFNVGTKPLSLGTINPEVPADVKADIDRIVADMKSGKWKM
ncbi:MAG: BMP family protein [Alphaproteobacteria bacterium]|nr:BMP family protein [Alphaproteobacteria bacterium]